MTNQEFDNALSRCNKQFQTGEAAKAARRVLVDGLSKSAAAREFGRTREWARVAVARIEREHLGIVGAPPGWICKTVCIPQDIHVSMEISDIERREKKKIGLIID